MYRPQTTLKQILTIALLLGASAFQNIAQASTALPSPRTVPIVEPIGIPVKPADVPVEPAGVPAEEIVPAVEVRLAAAATTTSWDSSLPDVEPFDLPVLYLHHSGAAADEAERRLTAQLSGLAGGTEVELEIVSWHEVPPSTDIIGRAAKRLWQPHRQARRFALPERPCTALDPCAVQWPLDAAATLSDLYRVTLRDDAGELLWESSQPDRPDLAVLDTWETGLDGYTVRVTYAALFPFARGERQLYHRLEPDAVHELIAHQFMPIVIETWQTQFHAWGYGPMHPEWDADGVVEVFFTSPPFALFGGIGTYTASTYSDGSPYPERRIWLQPSHNGMLERYDSLENGYRVIFSHEFHHMAQWNVRLSAGCPAPKWTNVFIEAQAKVASSVQYPELELRQDHLTMASSGYSSVAQRFLALRLETSYADLEAETSDIYDAALYWRFLYEQFGDMGVLRAALEEMACRPVDDVPATLGEIVDAALARLNGPFETYAQSLAAFAEANYALRLEDGRCAAAGGGCGGRYEDPEGMYGAPTLEEELAYRGLVLAYDGSIPASYGTDLIEVAVDPDLESGTLTIEFHSEGAQFSVQAWRLDSVGESGLRALTPHPEALAGDCSAECRYVLTGPDLAQADRLALIVVRLDPHEAADPIGAYTLTVNPAR